MAGNYVQTEFMGLNSFTPVMPVGPSAPYMSGPMGETETSSSSSKKSSKGTTIGGLDENMVEWLYLKGLASDVEAFLSQMGIAINNAYNPKTGETNLAMFKILLPKMALLRQEKDEFENAVKEMRANGAIDEIAINTRGEVYIVDPEKGLITTKINQIQQGQRLLTNGELANLRSNDVHAAFNTDFTHTIANGTSVEKIIDYINKSIAGLGTQSQERTGYMNQDSQLLQGGEVLKLLIKDGSLLKLDVKLSTQYEQAMAALSTILKTLPENMRGVLLVKALNSGTSVEDLVTSLVMSKTSTFQKVDASVIGSHSSGTGSKSNNGDTSLDDLSKLAQDPVTMFALGKTPLFSFKMDLGGKYAYVGMARLGHLLDGTGKPMAPYDTLQDVFAGRFSGILDQNNVTMGSMKIRSFDEVRIANNQISSIELPVDTSSNVLKPDLQLLEATQRIEQKIQDEGIDPNDYAKINELYTAEGLPPKYDEEGNLQEHFARFAVISAYANKDALETLSDVDEGFDSTISTVPEGNLRDALVRHFELRRGSSKIYSVDKKNLIQGNVFIPIISPQNGYAEAILAAYQTNGVSMNTGLADQLQQQAGQDQAKNQYGFVSGGSFVE